MEPFEIIAFVVMAPLMWVAIAFAISYLGGWAALARRFRNDQLPAGKAFYMRSGSVGIANYGACLTLRVSETGLHMSVLFPFRLAHPPLLIPWNEFHSTTKKRILFSTVTDTYVGMPVLARLRLPGWVSDYVEQHSAPDEN
jgi:hypothetical protein